MAINDEVIRVSLDVPTDLYLKMRDACIRRSDRDHGGRKRFTHRDALLEGLAMWLKAQDLPAPIVPNRPRAAR